jgi:tRNA A37 threonylcarbamoyltransferase TsaD
MIFFDMTLLEKQLMTPGEAFDKSAKYRLPYPGGPLVDKMHN